MKIPITIIHNPYSYGFYDAFFGAAIPEEIAKYLIIYFYCLKQPCFDEKMDGLVYGATASLGFPAFENIFYVFTFGYGVAIVRTVTSIPCHAIFGMNTGYYAARCKFGKNKNRNFIIYGLIISILLHGFYDLPLLIINRLKELRLFKPVDAWFILLFLLILLSILIYGWRIIRKVKKEQALI